ncbi:MAG: MmgE/PrpD family protein, partial [Gammaproteobacteria bacterium]
APADIAAIDVRVPLAGARYPGCDAHGPFDHVLQGKMSIQFNVAATLVSGAAGEHNFALLDDAAVRGLIARTTLTVDEALTAAYPGAQGAEVVLTLRDGHVLRRRLDDVRFASADEVRARFKAALTEAFDAAHADAVDAAIESFDSLADAGDLPRLLRRARRA